MDLQLTICRLLVQSYLKNLFVLKIRYNKLVPQIIATQPAIFVGNNFLLILIPVKRIFPIIIVLITISLIGIIVIQISWLDNMILAREEQTKEKLIDISQTVANELAQLKGHNITPKRYPDFEGFALDQSKPYTLGSRLTAEDIKAKIDRVFAAQ